MEMTVSTPTPPKLPGAAGYEVARPLGKCAVSGQEILPGQKYMAALRETPAGFERLDVSMEHWGEVDRQDLLGFWQTLMPHPEQKKQLFVDDEVLAGLFERLADTTEPAKLNFRFVLGLILIRKRKLVYESSRSEGGKDLWQVRLRGSEQSLELVDPKLSEPQMLEVSQQMSQILNEEL
jgi:hypothetical protein